VVIAGVLVSGLALFAQAQNQHRPKPTTQATLAGVHVSGSKHFSDAEIAAAAGLTVGATVGPADFQNAANKLVATGAFEEVGYKYEPAGTGYSVTFNLTDSSSFIPVTYDNFVWFTDQELNDAARKRVPLFNGAVATTGEMVDQVTEALQSIIAERGISGEVSFMHQESDLGGPINGGVFTITGLTVHVRQVNFPGAAEADIPMLEEAAKGLVKAPYQRSMLGAFAELNLRPLYRQRGYLKVSFGQAEMQLLDKDPHDPVVGLTVPVIPGAQYRVAEMQWSGNKAFYPQELSKLVTVRAGGVANAVQLQRDVEGVVKLYGTKGYLRAAVTIDPSFDDAQRMVTYEMRVKEGDVYRLGSVDVTGLDKQTNARLREAWKMREGDPYDTSYEREYMKVAAPILARNISVRTEKNINEKSHTVDVTMQFIVHADKVIK
jgi:outer membrane protein assembly factor BamA